MRSEGEKKKNGESNLPCIVATMLYLYGSYHEFRASSTDYWNKEK